MLSCFKLVITSISSAGRWNCSSGLRNCCFGWRGLGCGKGNRGSSKYVDICRYYRCRNQRRLRYVWYKLKDMTDVRYRDMYIYTLNIHIHMMVHFSSKFSLSVTASSWIRTRYWRVELPKLQLRPEIPLVVSLVISMQLLFRQWADLSLTYQWYFGPEPQSSQDIFNSRIVHGWPFGKFSHKTMEHHHFCWVDKL